MSAIENGHLVAVWPPLPPEPPHKKWTIATILAPLLISVIAGASFALIWNAVVPDPFVPSQYYNSEYDIWLSQDLPELMAGRDSTFALGAAVLGLLSGLFVAMTASKPNAGLRIIMWIIGGLVGSLIIYQVGVFIRPLAETEVSGIAGAVFPLGLRSYGALLIWPFVTAGIAFLGTLISVAFGTEVVDEPRFDDVLSSRVPSS